MQFGESITKFHVVKVAIFIFAANPPLMKLMVKCYHNEVSAEKTEKWQISMPPLHKELSLIFHAYDVDIHTLLLMAQFKIQASNFQ